jgi:SAM-dependent methyltransferase
MERPPQPYGELVARTGLSDSHRLMLEAVPDGARVLDVGCATGYLAEHLSRRGCAVVGLEADSAAAAAAEAHCERVIVGDVESVDTRGELPRGNDVVLLGDVLEHLRDPAAVLSAMRELLGPAGAVVASIPNVGVWSARLEVMRGRFPYADSGIFDRTHLRFFTRASAHALVRDAGFDLVDEGFTRSPLPGERTLYRLLGVEPAGGGDAGGAAPGQDADGTLQALGRRIHAVALAIRPELFANQFVLTLRPRA